MRADLRRHRRRHGRAAEPAAGPLAPARRRHAGGLATGPARQIAQGSHRQGRRAAEPGRGPEEPKGSDRHRFADGATGLPHLRGIGGVRAGTHPRADPSRTASCASARTTRGTPKTPQPAHPNADSYSHTGAGPGAVQRRAATGLHPLPAGEHEDAHARTPSDSHRRALREFREHAWGQHAHVRAPRERRRPLLGRQRPPPGIASSPTSGSPRSAPPTTTTAVCRRTASRSVGARQGWAARPTPSPLRAPWSRAWARLRENSGTTDSNSCSRFPTPLRGTSRSPSPCIPSITITRGESTPSLSLSPWVWTAQRNRGRSTPAHSAATSST